MTQDHPSENTQVAEYGRQARARAAEESVALENSGDDKLLEYAAADESGDAAFFVYLFKDKLVFDHAQGVWYEFQNHYWAPCEIEEPLERVGRLIKFYAEAATREFFRKVTAAKSGREKEAARAEANEKVFLKKIAKLQRRLHRNNVLILAPAGEGSLGVSGKRWDAEPLLLPCSNGVLDLATGEFRDGRPGDFITKYAPVVWMGFDAQAPRWEAYIREILGNDAEKVAFFKRLLGSFITGNVTEAVFPVLWGTGRNGKSILLETLAYVLGLLSGPVQSEMLMQQKQPRSAAAPSPDIIALRGMRLVWASESDEGRRLNSGKIKWFTGNDTLVARGPYDRRMVTFKPSHSLMLITNFRPTGNAADAALWARIVSLRFPFSFVDNPTKEHEKLRDPQLADELKREGPGILAWLVAGYYEWLEKGLVPPPSVLSETDDYRLSDDSIQHFLNERCVISKNSWTKASEIYECYLNYCEEVGFKPKGKRSLYQRLTADIDKDERKDANYYALSIKDA